MASTKSGIPDYVCAVDIGGTFTDCVLIDETGSVTTAKAPSTDDIVGGFFDSIETAAEKRDLTLNQIFDNVLRLAHGTTVATNMVVEDSGATTGLLTTQGHEDAVRMMRGLGRTTGEPPENVFRVAEVDKPDSIVSKELIRGIPERVDSNGDIIVELDEAAAQEAVRELVDAGVDAIAVSLLWSFRNPTHEQRIRDIVTEIAPDVYVSCSSDVSPTLGEYERTVATSINSIVGPGTSSYLQKLNTKLSDEYDFDDPVLLMQSNGGTAPGNQAADHPITLIGSGPVGGMRACVRLFEDKQTDNVIATDMGGTSFEVGIIQDGDPLIKDQSVIESYPYNISKLDIESIGAGGGSIAWVDEHSQSLRIGPESAGANPGPACYQRGGERPTVTDADLLLGYIDSEAQIGEHITPSKEHARDAIRGLADDLGMSVLDTARGIYDVANTKMANLMQNKVIGRGYDPRDFGVVSYGGAGPIHAASYASELGASEIVVPGEISPVWSAYGVSHSNVQYELEEEVIILEPFDPAELEDIFVDLESQGEEMLRESGMGSEDLVFNRIVKMRYEGQVHELNVEVPDGKLDEEAIDELKKRFEAQYEQRYSPAARLPEARPEIVTVRSEPVGRVDKFERQTVATAEPSPPSVAEKGMRDVYLDDKQGSVPVPVYDGTELRAGNVLKGPVIADLNNTSIVAHEGQRVSVNEYHDYEITL